MTTLSVPTILNILNDENNNYMSDQNMDTPRARKRRLDHLSWEEKIQRKKLKNRVAAQTSRDRKKAKLEQMEKAIQQLFSKNETLISECEQLKETNERLQAENAELRNRLQGMEQCHCQKRPVVCKSEYGSTERNGHAHSSGFDQPAQNHPPEDNPDLPSLPDLLDELDSEAVDLNALEQLTQTLLEDIARDLECASEKATQQETTPISTENKVGQMVGTTSENVESSRSKVLDNKSTLEQDISEYLLLHHNYAKSLKPNTPRVRSRTGVRKFKTIRPKMKKCIQTTQSEVVYGTLQPITILINEDSTPLNEVVIKQDSPLVVDTNLLHLPKYESDVLSPKSDLGYESIDSPQSSSDIDSWDQSVSELFPSLI